MANGNGADKIIMSHVLWSMGAGLIPVPLVDVAAVTAIQIDMLKQLATLHRVDYKASGGKRFVAALSGGMFARLGASVVKAVPGVGTLVGGASMSVLSGASTYAVGKVATSIFGSGGDLSSADLDSAKKAFEETLEEGKQYATNLRQTASSPQDVFGSLEQLGELKEKGIITEQDFDEQKQKLLSRI